MAELSTFPIDRHIGFQNKGLPNPVFKVTNLADNNPIHTTDSKFVNVKPSAEQLPTDGPADLHNSEELPGQCQMLIGS